jgi:hypothetical protein
VVLLSIARVPETHGVLVRVVEMDTGAAIVSALVQRSDSTVAVTDSRGEAWIPVSFSTSLRVMRTGYVPAEAMVGASDTLRIELARAPFPMPAVEIRDSREHGGVWKHAAVVCSTTAGHEDLAATLEAVPGVDVDGSAGGMAVSIRGAGPSGTAAWLDGMPLGQSLFGGADLGGILPGVLEGLSVYQGWAPMSLGGVAMGGGVSLETTRRLPVEGARVRAGCGSLGRWDAGAGYGAVLKSGWIYAGLEGLMQDNDFSYLDDNATQFNTMDDTTRNRANNRIELLNVLVKSVLGGGERDPWTLTSLTMWRREGVPGPATLPALKAAHESAAQRLIARRAQDLGQRWVVMTAGFAEWTTSCVKDPDAELSHLAATTESSGRSIGGSVACEGRGMRLRPDARAEVRTERFSTEGPGVVLPKGWHSRTTASPSLGLTWDAAASLRCRVEGTAGRYWDGGEGAQVHHELTTGRAALEYRLSARTLLMFSLSLQGRAPTLAELFGNAGSVRGNLQLTPERGTQIEAVVVLWDGVCRLAGYRRMMKDQIHFWLRSPRVVVPENIGESTMSGVEVLASVSISPRVTLDVHGAYQKSEDLSDAPYYRHNQLPGWPEWQGGLDVRVHAAEWCRVGGGIRGRDDVFIDRANRRISKGTALAGAWAEADALRSLLFGISGENLFDQKGVDRWGYPEPGLRLRCRVSCRF